MTSSKLFSIYVYLAGGMHSNWQDKVINYFSGGDIRFLDPRNHGLTEETEYTAWDLRAIDNSLVVFAYLARDNPSGFGMMLELGYAKAKGKYIIFINDKLEVENYCGMARAVANFHTHSLVEGMYHLENLKIDVVL